MDAFTAEQDWKDQVAYVDNPSKIKKEDIVEFANKYLRQLYIFKEKEKTAENIENRKLRLLQLMQTQVKRRTKTHTKTPTTFLSR
jgi:hypothetical protein